MMSFTLSCEDYEEAEYVFTEFAETCRKIRGTLAKRPRKTAASAQAIELTTAPERKVGKSPDLAAPYTNGHAADDASALYEPGRNDLISPVADAASNVTEPAPKKRGRPAGSKNKSEATATQYAPTEKIEEKQTVTVTPPVTITLDALRKTVQGITASGGKNGAGVHKVAGVLREFSVTKLHELKPEQYDDVYRKLTAAIDTGAAA